MKYVLTVLITAIVVAAGAYIYFKGFPSFPSYSKNPISTESAVVATEEPVATPLQTVAPSATASASSTIKAGGILSMSAYSITFPNDWIPSKTGSVAGQSDKLTLTKGAYSITISQGAFGGGGCLYPGDPDAEMSQRFVSFTSVTDQSGDSLRVGALATGGMVVCQGSGSGWGDITSFGHVNISAPLTPSQAILAEINSILSTLKKI